MQSTIQRRLIPDDRMAEAEALAVAKHTDSLTFDAGDAATVKGWLMGTAKPRPSRGLGDTVAKIAKATGIKAVVKAVVGKDCGCAGRQKKLNDLLPYRGEKNT
jgi:hypothetical protein